MKYWYNGTPTTVDKGNSTTTNTINYWINGVPWVVYSSSEAPAPGPSIYSQSISIIISETITEIKDGNYYRYIDPISSNNTNLSKYGSLLSRILFIDSINQTSIIRNSLLSRLISTITNTFLTSLSRIRSATRNTLITATNVISNTKNYVGNRLQNIAESPIISNIRNIQLSRNMETPFGGFEWIFDAVVNNITTISRSIFLKRQINVQSNNSLLLDKKSLLKRFISSTITQTTSLIRGSVQRIRQISINLLNTTNLSKSAKYIRNIVIQTSNNVSSWFAQGVHNITNILIDIISLSSQVSLQKNSYLNRLISYIQLSYSLYLSKRVTYHKIIESIQLSFNSTINRFLGFVRAIIAFEILLASEVAISNIKIAFIKIRRIFKSDKFRNIIIKRNKQ